KSKVTRESSIFNFPADLLFTKSIKSLLELWTNQKYKQVRPIITIEIITKDTFTKFFREAL
ncbi:MAG: hypothetical protein ABIO81_07205, partial [Ginsengibacter sp.]